MGYPSAGGMGVDGPGSVRSMTIVSRVIEAIVTVITAPFRALGALFGRRGAGQQRR